MRIRRAVRFNLGDQRGSTVVEAALILLPLMAFVCAVIDASMVMFVKNTLIHATREGVRYAITSRTEPGMCQDASIKSIVQRNSFGFLNGTQGLARIQVEYLHPQTFQPAANRAGNIVQVSVVGMPWSWIVPIWHNSSSVAVSASASDILESQPAGSPCR
jgi:hypothetical protein